MPPKPFKPRSVTGECYRCVYMRAIPGDAHIQCTKPDPQMTGDPLGAHRGWFWYPANFDPIWKTRLCENFQDAK